MSIGKSDIGKENYVIRFLFSKKEFKSFRFEKHLERYRNLEREMKTVEVNVNATRNVCRVLVYAILVSFVLFFGLQIAFLPIGNIIEFALLLLTYGLPAGLIILGVELYSHYHSVVLIDKKKEYKKFLNEHDIAFRFSVEELSMYEVVLNKLALSEQLKLYGISDMYLDTIQDENVVVIHDTLDNKWYILEFTLEKGRIVHYTLKDAQDVDFQLPLNW